MYHDSLKWDDPTECPGENCGAEQGPYGMTYAHKHCAIDGCVLHAEGGGGDDGSRVGGYTDGVQCAGTCGDYVGVKCARRGDNNEPLCIGCEHAQDEAIFTDSLLERQLTNALEDVTASRGKLHSETRIERLERLRPLINQLRLAVDDYDRALAPKIIMAFSTPLPIAQLYSGAA